MSLKVKKWKNPPFPNPVANGNESGIIAMVGTCYIILAKNISTFRHRSKTRQEKRKKFSNFFTKTSTVFLYGVGQYPKVFQQSTRALMQLLAKAFWNRPNHSVCGAQSRWPRPTLHRPNFFLTPPLSRGYKKLHFITFLTSPQNFPIPLKMVFFEFGVIWDILWGLEVVETWVYSCFWSVREIL